MVLVGEIIEWLTFLFLILSVQFGRTVSFTKGVTGPGVCDIGMHVLLLSSLRGASLRSICIVYLKQFLAESTMSMIRVMERFYNFLLLLK